MILERSSCFLLVFFQEMKAAVLVRLEPQGRRDAAVKSALFSSAAHNNSGQVFVH